MNKQLSLILGFGVLFLLFVQSIATFIEGIYILELLSTSLDEKVLGILFLFSPILLLPFGKRVPRWLIWVSYSLLVIGRGVIPYLGTYERMIAAGIACGAALVLIPIMLVTYPEPRKGSRWLIPAQGLALAVGLSVLLRTLNFTIDISMTSTYGWSGWILAILLGLTLTQFKWEDEPEESEKIKGVTSAAIGLVGVLMLFYIMLSSPGVIARWTEGNYQLIVITVSLLSLLWLFSSLVRPKWIVEIKPGWLTLWNLCFTISVTLTILAHTFRFPAAPDSPAMVVSNPLWYQQIPLLVMLLSFPVILIDFGIFSGLIARAQATPRKMAPGFLIGVVFMILVIFMNIFSNTWGYVEPISPFFRNKFWFALLLIAGLITILAFVLYNNFRHTSEDGEGKQKVLLPAILLGVIFVATLISALQTDRYLVPAPIKDSLKVMTYNIQQANDVNGEKSYLEQLALIREVDPDVIGFQESDSTRISLGNNDYIRYYANKLGYHAYFGPKTVTGTYGTAILSKYPLENPRSVFTFSDQDEIGTAEAEISVGGRIFTIFNVHPDGSDEAKLVFARTLVDRANEKPDVIAIGDYNLRGWEEPYLLIDGVYKNAWMDVYPTGIDENGLDMSGENRIDHIFVSPHLEVRNPVYILPPESWTDHPVHWTEIFW
ncbi:MAG: endonuclease/exonuclease/phosphatase family protein [Anaerolineales bacterium]